MAEGRAVDLGLDEPPSATPPNPPRPWYRKLRWRITTATILGLLIAALLWWSPWDLVRVTDGSELLADDLADVLGRIHQENERVTDSGRPWVSIAIMLPIRTTDDPRNNPDDALRHLQGAYLAQYWSNNPDGDDKFGSKAPLIRLLVADTGQDGQAWRDTVAELVTLADFESDARLVAVTGLGLSTDATQGAVNALADAGIPMVSSVITATGLTAPGLFRAAPSNSDEAATIIGHLKNTEEWRSATTAEPYQAYLIQDRAADDVFVKDLGDQYRQKFPDGEAHRMLDAQGEFDSQKEAAGNAIKAQIAMICSIRPNVVFFAGRDEGLRTFLRELAARYCTDTPITVVTGDSGNNLHDPTGTNQLWITENAKLDVLYTGLASSKTWEVENYRESVSPDTVEHFGDCRNCFATLFSEPLDEEDSIMSHDAVLTAITAARNVTSQPNQPSTTDVSIPSANALINGLYQITWAEAVPGASGWIYFQRDPDTPDGVPYNKAMPIIKLKQNGTTELVELSSRSGTPPGIPEQPS